MLNNSQKKFKKKITFVTGTRADFGKIKSLALKLIEHGHEVSFFVTGMHMLKAYGSTFIEVRRISDAQSFEYVNQRAGDPLDIIYAKTVIGFSDWLNENNPDLVIVHGDRVEALACSFVCATNYVRCLHLEGGEVSGTIDEVFRHCITKFAHHHFACSSAAKKNIENLGEESNRIKVIGSPELDVHGQDQDITIEQVRSYYRIPFENYAIVIFHPVTSEQNTITFQAQQLFKNLKISGKNYVVISSNNDPGSTGIMAVTQKLPNDRFISISSMRFEYFSILMKNAGCIIGNSSTGVREAPFLGVPSLNIGSRQFGRSKAASITHVNADDNSLISSFLSEEWYKRYPPSFEFGNGDSINAFCELLADSDFWLIPMQKKFSQP